MGTERADYNTYTLVSNVSGAQNGPAVPIRGGEYAFAVAGTPGGASIDLEMLLPNGDWAEITSEGEGVVVTAPPMLNTCICLPAGQVRLHIGTGAATGIYAWLFGLG